MANIRKRGERWHVQVRRKGTQPLCKSFGHRRDAEAWAREVESNLDKGQQPVQAPAKQPYSETVGAILLRYAQTVSPTKRGADVETVRLNAISRQSLGHEAAAMLTTATFARWRDERLTAVSSSTFLREYGLVRRALTVARHEWGLPVPLECFDYLSKPKPRPGVIKRLPPDAEAALLGAAKRMHNKLMAPAIVIALETGLRRGELVALEWHDIDFQQGLVHVRCTKNGHPRLVPMTARCRTELVKLEMTKEQRPIPCTGSALHQSFVRARDRALKNMAKDSAADPRSIRALQGLRFHDLRHEAISRLVELGLSIIEVAEVSGHRTLSMVKRYAHADILRIAARMQANPPHSWAT